MKWSDVIFYLIFFLVIGGAFEGSKEVVKLWINRRYDAKIAKARAEANLKDYSE